MPKLHTRFLVFLIVPLLLTTWLLSCGGGRPPQTPTTTAFTSPLAEPTTASLTVQPKALAPPPPTGTPDPNRTPVAIVRADIRPDREVVTIQNISTDEQDVSGWILFNLSDDDPVFRFPDGLVLAPGDTVQIYSAVSEEDVPEGAYFWTTEKVWHNLPADVLLLNKATRLVYWYVAYGEEGIPPTPGQ